MPPLDSTLILRSASPTRAPDVGASYFRLGAAGLSSSPPFGGSLALRELQVQVDKQRLSLRSDSPTKRSFRFGCPDAVGSRRAAPGSTSQVPGSPRSVSPRGGRSVISPGEGRPGDISPGRSTSVSVRGMPAGKLVETFRTGAAQVLSWPHQRGAHLADAGLRSSSPSKCTRLMLRTPREDAGELDSDSSWLACSPGAAAMEKAALGPRLPTDGQQAERPLSNVEAASLAAAAASEAEAALDRRCDEVAARSPSAPNYGDNPWRVGLSPRTAERGATRLFPCHLMTPHATGGVVPPPPATLLSAGPQEDGVFVRLVPSSSASVSSLVSGRGGLHFSASDGGSSRGGSRGPSPNPSPPASPRLAKKKLWEATPPSPQAQERAGRPAAERVANASSSSGALAMSTAAAASASTACSPVVAAKSNVGGNAVGAGRSPAPAAQERRLGASAVVKAKSLASARVERPPRMSSGVGGGSGGKPTLPPAPGKVEGSRQPRSAAPTPRASVTSEKVHTEVNREDKAERLPREFEPREGSKTSSRASEAKLSDTSASVGVGDPPSTATSGTNRGVGSGGYSAGGAASRLSALRSKLEKSLRSAEMGMEPDQHQFDRRLASGQRLVTTAA